MQNQVAKSCFRHEILSLILTRCVFNQCYHSRMIVNKECKDGGNEKHDRKPPVCAERAASEQQSGARRPHGLPKAGQGGLLAQRRTLCRPAGQGDLIGQ